MKKIFVLLIRHIEKVVLAILMVVFIILLLIQLKNIGEMQKRKREVEAITATGGGRRKQKIEPVNEAEYTFSPDIQELWSPAYNLGAWKKYIKSIDPRIASRYRKSPPSPPLTEEYRDYGMEYGIGTLFDPLLYVRPLRAPSGQNYIVAFETVRCFFPPYPLDIPSLTEEISKTPETASTGKQSTNEAGTGPELHNWFRLVRARVPYLPFRFKSVTASDPEDSSQWFFVFDVYMGRRAVTKIVKIGQEIGKTGYRLTDGKAKPVQIKRSGELIKTYTYEAVISHIDRDETYTLRKGERPIDKNKKIVYECVFYPEVVQKKIRRLYDRQFVKLQWNQIDETYFFAVVDNKPYLYVTTGNDNREPDLNSAKRFPVLGIDKNDYRKWKQKYMPSPNQLQPGMVPNQPVPGQPIMPPGGGDVIAPRIGN
ncbi:MAG: hypothetical protein D6820_18505 [Lentisphaerae bacterium]|nr:MAG: hypothetical protein D6820_18505 [Lentisphaerota bacterium]